MTFMVLGSAIATAAVLLPSAAWLGELGALLRKAMGG
jgi:hypothetical protein